MLPLFQNDLVYCTGNMIGGSVSVRDTGPQLKVLLYFEVMFSVIYFAYFGLLCVISCFTLKLPVRPFI